MRLGIVKGSRKVRQFRQPKSAPVALLSAG
jgi:hypothetical protein